MLCPVCKTVNLAMTDRQGIEIDYCPNCRGVWLDRGELDRLIERAEQSAAPAPAPPQAPPQYGHPYPPSHGSHEGYRHGQKRHKSLLGELFDF
jgi:uncharacterized protein